MAYFTDAYMRPLGLKTAASLWGQIIIDEWISCFDHIQNLIIHIIQLIFMRQKVTFFHFGDSINVAINVSDL